VRARQDGVEGRRHGGEVARRRPDLAQGWEGGGSPLPVLHGERARVRGSN
jgi:hypothetical protein